MKCKGQLVKILCEESVHKGEVVRVATIDIRNDKQIIGVTDTHGYWVGRYWEDDLEVIE